MIDKNVFWVWAQHAFGEGSRKPWHIHCSFPGGLEGFYRAGATAWCRLDYISHQQIDSLLAFDLNAAMLRLQFAAQMGWQALTPESEKYPDGLRNISDPPAVLYMQGELEPLLDAPWVAVAGARKASAESMKAARRIAYQLATAGAVVVSGMAQGIDTAAQEGAMEALGRTACVVPVDLASPYLDRPGRLCQKVVGRGGVLLSEYFSQRNPAQGGFQQRNRLITGMCRAVVLVQAGEKGGTRLYGRFAAKQGRPVFVVPGPPGDPAFAGSRALLAEGAQPIESGWELVQARPDWFGMPGLGAGIADRPAQLEGGPPVKAFPPPQGPAGEAPRPGRRTGTKSARRQSGPEAEPAGSGQGAADDAPYGLQQESFAESRIRGVLADGGFSGQGPLVDGGEFPAPAPAGGLPQRPALAGIPAPTGPTEDGELLALLEKERTVEELSALSGASAGLLLTRLARLELLGRVERSQTGRYRRT